MSQFRHFLQAKISQYLYGGSGECFRHIESADDGDLEHLNRLLEKNAQDFEAKALAARELQRKICEILRQRRLRQQYKDLIPSILQGKVSFFHNNEHESFFQEQNATEPLFQCCKATVEFEFDGHCYNDDDHHEVEDTFSVNLDESWMYEEENVRGLQHLGIPKDMEEHFPNIGDLIWRFADSAEFKKTIEQDTVIDNFDHENRGDGPNLLIWTGTLPVYYVIPFRSAECDK